ncbi:MAG: type IV-A pilus assembly ATPase PilB, partial [Halioglobus sp.]
MNSSAASLSGLARRLVKEGHLSMEAAQTAAAEARQARAALVHHLVAGGHVSAAVVARSAAEEFGDPLIDLNTFSKDAMVKDIVDPKLITKHTILPLLRRGSRLFVAVSDPTNLPALEEIRFNTGLNVETVIAEDDKLRRWIDQLESEQEGKAFDNLDDDLDNLETADTDAVPSGGEDAAAGSDDAPIVRFVNKLLLDAIKGGASDLHFEPYEKTYRVRFR